MSCLIALMVWMLPAGGTLRREDGASKVTRPVRNDTEAH